MKLDLNLRSKSAIVLSLYLVFFAVGTLGHYLEATRQLMLTLTPWFLLVFGISALIPAARQGGRSFVLWALGSFILTFTLEAIGVATGKIFGEYFYGDTLGVKVFQVPLIIGFNWLVVVAAIAVAISRIIRSPLVAALVTGLSAALFDLALEPVAIRFDYWSWSGPAVPLQNYLAWFVIAFVVSFPFFLLRLKWDKNLKSRMAVIYIFAQTLFVISLLPLSI